MDLHSPSRSKTSYFIIFQQTKSDLNFIKASVSFDQFSIISDNIAYLSEHLAVFEMFKNQDLNVDK